MAKLIRIDRNGTEYWEETKCPKCGGTGYIAAYHHVDGGRCFYCDGTGYHRTTWKVMTPEYSRKLEERRNAKAEKKAPERRQKFLEKNGFDTNGYTWLVKGNTFEIKDELKEAGAKFNPLLKWHFNSETKFDSVKIHVTDLFKETLDEDGYVEKCEAYEVVENLLKEESTSEYVGTIGDKVELELTIKFIRTFESLYYNGADTAIIVCEDADGNAVVIKTTTSTKLYDSIDEENTYTVKGTVKEHSEYKETKQTILTRCKVI